LFELLFVELELFGLAGGVAVFELLIVESVLGVGGAGGVAGVFGVAGVAGVVVVFGVSPCGVVAPGVFAVPGPLVLVPFPGLAPPFVCA
jgi:hypothetical protein